MTIIEVDGVETKPHTVDSLIIFAAQRYSVIVKANQPIGNYCVCPTIYLPFGVSE